MNKIVIVLTVLALIVFAGLYAFKFRDQDDTKISEYPKVVVPTASTNSSPTPKPVTNDDSFSSIETDLNNTVILEEDFSDIK